MVLYRTTFVNAGYYVSFFISKKTYGARSGFSLPQNALRKIDISKALIYLFFAIFSALLYDSSLKVLCPGPMK